MAANNGAIKLVAGNSNRALSEAIGAYLQTPLTRAEVRRFADMEVFVEIKENVRAPTSSCCSRPRSRRTTI